MLALAGHASVTAISAVNKTSCKRPASVSLESPFAYPISRYERVREDGVDREFVGADRNRGRPRVRRWVLAVRFAN